MGTISCWNCIGNTRSNKFMNTTAESHPKYTVLKQFSPSSWSYFLGLFLPWTLVWVIYILFRIKHSVLFFCCRDKMLWLGQIIGKKTAHFGLYFRKIKVHNGRWYSGRHGIWNRKTKIHTFTSTTKQREWPRSWISF